ncbi:transposase [Bradyrhizobium sp. JR1.5]
MEASPHGQTALAGSSSSHYSGAVEVEGMSCRGAAGRFGVAPSTAIELVSEWRSKGSCEAGAQGGDRRSARIEGHAAEILALVEVTPDMTLAELADHLFKARGERFVPSVLWRFFDRFKKNIARQRAGSAGRGRRTRRVEGISA